MEDYYVVIKIIFFDFWNHARCVFGKKMLAAIADNVQSLSIST